MPEFKVVVSQPKEGTAKAATVTGEQAAALLGLRIGDTLDGSAVGMPNVRLRITGGSDKGGFPMRRDLSGSGKRYVLLASPPGYNPAAKGERRKKMVRGSSISEDIVQVNMVVMPSSEEKAEPKASKEPVSER